jgi:hypothetical protein
MVRSTQNAKDTMIALATLLRRTPVATRSVKATTAAEATATRLLVLAGIAHLPPGTAIDATNPDRWIFPVGTQLFKEFSSHGDRVETRRIQRHENGTWSFATYLGNEAGRARLSRSLLITSPMLP